MARSVTSRAAKKRRKKRRFTTVLLTLVFLACAGALFLLTFFPLSYDKEITAACETYGVSPSLVYAVVRVESNFDETAVSSAGALGLMQITPETYAWSLSRKHVSWNANTDVLLDPQVNLMTGAHVLSLLYEQFGNTDTVVAAYNAGYGNVEQWLTDPRYSSDGKTLDSIPYDETARYVEKIKRAQFAYKMIYDLD